MRLKSADQSMITDVSRLRPHRCTIITSIASNTDCGGGRRAAASTLDNGHQSKNRLPMSDPGQQRRFRDVPASSAIRNTDTQDPARHSMRAAYGRWHATWVKSAWQHDRSTLRASAIASMDRTACKWQFDTLRGSCARHLTRLHCYLEAQANLGGVL